MKWRQQRGALLIAAVVLIAVFGLLASVATYLFVGGSAASGDHLHSAQALFVAESGLEHAAYQLKSGVSCASLSSTQTVGVGSFTTTAAANNALSTLSSAITATDTVIPLASTSGFGAHGRITIGGEAINYVAKTATQLTGAKRGVAGTTAASHSSGTAVSQNQCLVTSSGTVGTARRVVERAVLAAGVFQGTLTKPVAAGSTSQSVTGLGFTPRAVIFFWTRQAATGFAQHLNAGAGFATAAAEQRAAAVVNVDDTSVSRSGRRRSVSNSIIFLANNVGAAAPAVLAQASLASFDTDGFTLNWNVVSDPNPYLVHYIALGGGITHAKAGSFTLTTAGGNQGVTGVGFRPDFIMFLWGHRGDIDTSEVRAEIGLGLAKSATARAAVVSAVNHGGFRNRQRWQQRINRAILLLDPEDPRTQDAIADFVSMDADGYTINKLDPPAANTEIFYLALKGGGHQVGAFNQPTAAGAQTVTGVGFQPAQVLLTSFNRAATTAISSGGAISLGAARSAASRGGVWFQERPSGSVTDANMYTSSSDVLTLARGPSTVNARADLSAFAADGFTLNWTTADGMRRQILYWAMTPGPLVPVDWREAYP